MSEMPDRPAPELHITPEMIEAGVWEAREHMLGAPLEDMVRNVFIAMAVVSSATPPPAGSSSGDS